MKQINKEEWEKEMWRCSDIAEVCRANLANHDYKLLTKTILNFIKVARQEAIKEFLGSDEGEEAELQEILFILMEEIIELKEKNCENSGWNWQDKIKPLIDKLN